MKRYLRFLLKLSISASLLVPAFLGRADGQQALSINGKQYIQSDSKWFQVEGDKRYEVNTSVITVKLKQGISTSQANALSRSQGAQVIRTNILGFIDLKISSGGDVFKIVKSYLGSGLVETAELNTFGEYTATPNDSLYPSQWNLNQTNDADIDMPEAWNITTGSPSAIVAVLDCGTAWTHKDLGPGTDGYQNIWLNSAEDTWTDPNDPTTGNGIDDDGDGLVDDWKGWDFYNNNNDSRGVYYHGTHVAGIVAAKTNNNRGVAGLAGGWGSQGAKLLIEGVGDYSPDGSILDDAILYAAQRGAKIITMSLDVGQSSAIDAALSSAYNTYGCFIDCASGNSGGNVLYPANNQYVVAVGATDNSDTRPTWSNYGAALDISAPGVNVYSTQLGDSYGTSSGTSFAAPHVAGVAALLVSLNPNLSPSQITSTLELSADDKGSTGRDDYYGYGRLNANAAVRNLYVPQVYTTIASALSAAVSGQTVIVSSGTHSISSNLTGPSGVSVTIKSGTTINLNGYYLRCTGAGVFNKETGSTINGLAASVQGANGGIYYTIQSAINCTPAGTIQLEARSYGESPSFSSKSNITLAGKGQGSTTIGSVSITNSSYIGVSNLTLPSVSLNNNNQTSIVNVTATSTSLAVDYGGTANTFNSVSANNLGASFGYTSYGGTGAFQPGCHIANGDCGIFLTNSASYTSSNDIFCCNGCDIDATGGAWAYSLNNTYSRPYPQSICGNVTCAGALNWVCGSQCEYRAIEATASRFAKLGLDSLHDLDVQYLALLTRINDDKATGKYVLANYLQDFQRLIDGYKTFLKGGSDKEIVKAALSKVHHLYKGMEDLNDFNAYVNVCLASGSIKPVESYFKRYLIWDQVDNRHYDNSITLADQIISSPDIDEDLNAEMFYEKGLIYKYYLDDSSKADEMFALLVSRYPSNPLLKLVEVETMRTPTYAPNEPVQDSTRQAENAAMELNNYPNPFNPSTLISYTLHVGGYVSLKVYDALGREVRTLVNENQLPGFHSVTFDGSRLSSGVYFYRFNAPGVNQVKKMILVK